MFYIIGLLVFGVCFEQILFVVCYFSGGIINQEVGFVFIDMIKMVFYWFKYVSIYNFFVRLIDRFQIFMRLKNLFFIFEYSVFSDKRCI